MNSLIKPLIGSSYIRSSKACWSLSKENWRSFALCTLPSKQTSGYTEQLNAEFDMGWKGNIMIVVETGRFRFRDIKDEQPKCCTEKTNTVAYNPKHWHITVESPARIHNNLFQARNLLFNLQWLYLHTCVSMLRKWITQVECVTQSLKNNMSRLNKPQQHITEWHEFIYLGNGTKQNSLNATDGHQPKIMATITMNYIGN